MIYISSVGYIINDILTEIPSLPINRSQFIPENATKLNSMAFISEYYLSRDHLPLDYPLTVYWDENYTRILSYGTAGDAAGFTGNVLAAEAYRYAINRKEGNISGMYDALSMVRRVIHGASLLLAVPNGGVGPQYSGILARSVRSPNFPFPIGGYQELTEDPRDVFNGTGVYQNWEWIGYPSIDQNCNLFFGLSRVGVFVSPYDQEIANITTLLGQQLIESLIKANWLLGDAGGRSTGQDVKVGLENSAYWILGSLKMAILTNPNNTRYRQLYAHYAYERDYVHALKPTYPLEMNNIQNFFSQNLQWMMISTLALEEPDPFLKMAYQEVIHSALYPPVHNSRNAWFNTAYLVLMNQKTPDICADIADQMMRFGIARTPTNTSRIPSLGDDHNPIPQENYGRPRAIQWHTFFTSTLIGSIFYG